MRLSRRRVLVIWTLLLLAIACSSTPPSDRNPPRQPAAKTPIPPEASAVVDRRSQPAVLTPEADDTIVITPTPARLTAVTATSAPSAIVSPPASVFVAATPAFTPLATVTQAAPLAQASATLSATVTASPSSTPVVEPGPTPDGQTRSLRVPILMYHYISDPPPGSGVYRRDLSVSPSRFESHLAYLRNAGYHSVTLDDLLYALTQGRSLPDKPVILTFDDGYEDNYTNAFPLLQKYGFVAEFFLITDFVNAGSPAYMTWPQIEAMAQAGQRFGSHSRNHPDLRRKPVDYLVWQALGGTEAIQQHLGYHPRWIAYPSGAYDDRTIAVFKSANYWGGLTTAQGATHSSDDLFQLSRVRVRGRHTADDLARLLKLNW